MVPAKISSLSLASAIILRTVSDGHCYGFDIMEATGLPSGTIYPALRRLEEAKLIRSDRDAAAASDVVGPPRKYFRITAEGRRALENAANRFPVIAGQRREP
jgi:DNA-binding PadR family transcriptional regulator